jgi:hypothetical protein
VAIRGAGLLAYLRHAFTFRWNVLLLSGALAASWLSPWPDVLLPLVAGLELTYLTGLLAIPRFRTAVDASVAAKERARRSGGRTDESAQHSLRRLLDGLPPEALRRFAALRHRCFQMRDIASGVRAHTGDGGDSADALQTPALDRLLFLFLKLLVTQDGLARFLKSTGERELTLRLDDVTQRLAAAQAAGDERVVRSLQDSVADATLRLDNYRKSVKDAEFVAIELDRIETKIQALTEMGISRQDPNLLSTQVTAAADSMRQTEEAVNQLQHLTGLADEIAEPPAILEADLGMMPTRDT